MEQKPLWEFTPLYASSLLISEEELIRSCSESWSTSIFEEKDHRMILRQVREHFEERLDLVILRYIARMIFHPDSVTFRVDELDVVFCLGTELTMDNTSTATCLESMIAFDDVAKIHSIQSLYFRNEHYADALICANMLIPNFLLSLPTQKEDHALNDWADSLNLYTAKVFQSRFIPSDIKNVAMVSITDKNTEDVEELVMEYGALVQFLGSHSACQNWKATGFLRGKCTGGRNIRDGRCCDKSMNRYVIGVEIVGNVIKCC